MSQNFDFFVPIDSFEKAKDKDGNEVMKIKGIASTADRDSDGEVLDPAGFDLSYFKKQGYLNWHHMRTPDGIIGEPVKAEIKNNQLHIEAILYPESKLARDAYNLASVLEKSSKTRRLGFSIEGKTIEVDPLDKKHITRAAITGCALTPMPKNPHTIAEIVKAHNIGQAFVDDSDLDIKKKKAKKKGLTTDSGRAVIPESVDGQKKDIKELTKAEVYRRIFSLDSSIGSSKAQKVYQLIEKVAMPKNTITEEDIQKAFELLGANSSLDISKGEDMKSAKNKGMNKSKQMKKEEETEEEAEEQEEEEEEEEDDDKATPEEFDKGKHGEEDDEFDKSYSACMSDLTKAMKKAQAMEKAYSKRFGKAGKIAKMLPQANSNSDATITKGGEIDILKGFADVNNATQAIGLILKAQNQQIQELKKSFVATTESLDNTVADLIDSVQDLSKGKQKSIVRPEQLNYRERFEKAETEGKEGTVVSIQNRKQVLEILDKATFAKGEIDEGFAKAMTMFESSGVLLPDQVERLYKTHGIRIV